MATKKKKKPKIRRVWQINPVTRVKPSARGYARGKAKEQFRKSVDEE